jgi:hypothetical protein
MNNGNSIRFSVYDRKSCCDCVIFKKVQNFDLRGFSEFSPSYGQYAWK